MVRMGELAASAVARRCPRVPRPGLVHRPGAAGPPARASPGWRTSCCPPAAGTAAPTSFKFADRRRARADRPRRRRRWPPADARGRAGRRREHVRRVSARRSRSASATRPPCATSSRPRGSRVIAAETGGDRGRTIRVHVGSRRVTVREAGGADTRPGRPAAWRPRHERPRPEPGRDRGAGRRGPRRPAARGEARAAASPPHARGRLHAPDQVHLRAGAPPGPHAGGLLPHRVDAPDAPSCACRWRSRC